MYLTEDELRATLRSLGAFWIESRLPEVLLICNLLQENENVEAVIFGKYRHFLQDISGRGALVATNFRMLLVDRKPMYLRYEEFPYQIISGCELTTTSTTSSLTLETRVGNISIRSWNKHCVSDFCKTIDNYIIRDVGAIRYSYYN